MMNQIIKGFLNEHISEYGISTYSEKDAFEHFINRCIVTKYTLERFDPIDIMTDAGEIGLDGVAIVINKQIITSLEDARIICDQGVDDVSFIFIQSKRSDSFDGGEMSTFAKGVRHFFEDSSSRPHTNAKMENLISIKDYIYSQIINIGRKPSLILCYVCCGKWTNGNNLQNTIQQDKTLFENTDDFEHVDYRPYDQNQIITLYKEMRRKIQRDFIMEKKMSFFSMPGIHEAYFGLIKCQDIISILSDEQGKLFNNIFEDNVRDFQGYNSVNIEIQETIGDKEKQSRFAILNNGITIIAKEIRTEGDKISIFDYQIVNGCQTSHVLFDNFSKLEPTSFVLAKIIRVENDEILDEIVYTSNRQTEVKYEAFTSANRFHKLLQEYYNSVDAKYRLFYERRSKQFDADASIDKNKIISLATQTKIYTSMFLNEPHSVHRYYGEILNAYKKRIYAEEDHPEPYYISSYILYLVDMKIKKNKIKKELKLFKFHICYAIRALTVGNQIVRGNSREIKKYFDALFELAKNEKSFGRALNTACSCIEECIRNSSDISNKDLSKSRDFTNRLTERIKEYNAKIGSTKFLKKGDVVLCQVTAIREYNIQVDIKADDSRKNGSIHISNIADRKIISISDEVKLGEVLTAKILSNYEDYPFGWSLSLLPKDINSDPIE